VGREFGGYGDRLGKRINVRFLVDYGYRGASLQTATGKVVRETPWFLVIAST